jgi:D-alanyl-D-alanine carboxypeptidase (penicillin-binding protein 5/6)
MNKKAAELGMKNTHFENTNGLDDTTENHVTSARDIAIMSRELIKHKKILEYSSIWMSTIRSGEFTLTNTNRLIRFYPGATGLKTGSTSKAKFCISATAQRDNLHLIAVIMGAPTRDIRNEEAKKLLDYGFANYGLYTYKSDINPNLSVVGGTSDKCEISVEDFSLVVDKSKISSIKTTTELPEKIPAPIKEGSTVGKVKFTCGDEIIGEANIISKQNIEKISYFEIFFRMLRYFTVAR